MLELREHLKRRGVDLTINFKVKAEEFLCHTVTVCEICYAVAIAEYHLMNVERNFAKAQTIPIKELNVTIDVGNTQSNVLSQKLAQPVLESTILNQWRILFYFNYLISILMNYNSSTKYIERGKGVLPSIQDISAYHKISF